MFPLTCSIFLQYRLDHITPGIRAFFAHAPQKIYLLLGETRKLTFSCFNINLEEFPMNWRKFYLEVNDDCVCCHIEYQDNRKFTFILKELMQSSAVMISKMAKMVWNIDEFCQEFIKRD